MSQIEGKARMGYIQQLLYLDEQLRILSLNRLQQGFLFVRL